MADNAPLIFRGCLSFFSTPEIFLTRNKNLFLFKFLKKKLHLSGHYIFSIKFETFLQTKIYPTLQKLNGQISNIVLNFFFPREVRDKNKESSMHTQNSWIVDIVWSFCTWQHVVTVQRRVWRYQRGNQNPYIEEQTTQWPKEKGQTTIYKTYT